MYDVNTGELARGRLQRPSIDIEIQRVHHKAWEIFRKYHYLNSTINKAAGCFVGYFEGQPVAFAAMLPFPHQHVPGWRLTRAVVLPDFQGVGIGNRFVEKVCSAYAATNKSIYRTMNHPAMVHSCANSTNWVMRRNASRVAAPGSSSGLKMWKKTMSVNRLTASFQYVGVSDVDAAIAFALI